MAQASLREDVTSYNPPRARWYSRLFFHAWKPLRRSLYFEKLNLPNRLSPLGWALSLAVPGFAFLALGRRLLGWLFLTVWCVAAFLFIAWLGYPAANICYGVMISVHALSIGFLEAQWLRESALNTRLFLAFGTLFALWGLIYAPLTGLAERHWIMPLRLGDRVMVVQCGVSAKSIKRGDWIAYRIAGDRFIGEREDRVYVAAGMGIDPVLALPGDRVRFSRDAMTVNGQRVPRAAHMPADGELTVPEKVWFIWPNLAIYMHGVPEGSISATMQQAAMVAQKQIIGRPFKYWFGRRQWP